MSADEIERQRQNEQLRRNRENAEIEKRKQEAANQSKRDTEKHVEAYRQGAETARRNYEYSRSCQPSHTSEKEDHPIVSAIRTIFSFIVILFTIGIIIGIASHLYPPLGNLIAPFTDPIWIYLGDLIVELNPN